MSSLPDEERWTLQLDFTNAFNNISREAMWSSAATFLASLLGWNPATRANRSCCGVQQGDPLGPLGFVLTLNPIIERIKVEVPTLALNA